MLNIFLNSCCSAGLTNDRLGHPLLVAKPSCRSFFARASDRGGNNTTRRPGRRALPVMDLAASHWHHRTLGRGFPCLLPKNGRITHWLAGEPVPIRGWHG